MAAKARSALRFLNEDNCIEKYKEGSNYNIYIFLQILPESQGLAIVWLRLCHIVSSV
jgi:hypothetical protein